MTKIEVEEKLFSALRKMESSNILTFVDGMEELSDITDSDNLKIDDELTDQEISDYFTPIRKQLKVAKAAKYTRKNVDRQAHLNAARELTKRLIEKLYIA